MFGREKLAKYSDEINAYIKAVDNITELQAAQREMADAIRRVSDRVQMLEVEHRALRAEIRADALRETQGVVNSVQGAFYQKLQGIAVGVAVLRRDLREAQDRSPRPRIASASGDEIKSFPEG